MSPGARVALWLAFSCACIAVAWLWPRVGLWWRIRQMRVVWQAREDMEAALWAECDEKAARAVPPWLGCTVPPEGWWCSRPKGHEGPCAARSNVTNAVSCSPGLQK